MEQPGEPFVLTAFDKQQLAGYRWRAQDVRGVLLMLHGYAEHAERHAGLASAAAASGLDVWAFDQRNHGNSPGAVRGSVPGFGLTLGDVAALQQLASEEAPQKPVFLFGHSMGGAIALNYALDNPERLRGLVLSAPFLLDAVQRPAWLAAAAGLLGQLLPSVPTTKVPPGAISRDPAQVTRYLQDPLNYTGGVRADAAATLLSTGAELSARAPQLGVDTLVVHGGGDRVASVEGSRRLAAASSRVTLVEIAGGYHELHHDSPASGAPMQARQAILEWLQQRLAGG